MSTLTPPEARSRVLLATVAAGGLTAVAVAVKGQPPRLRIFIGASVVAVVLLAAADSAPELVGRFATLILATSVLTAGAIAAGPLVRLLGNA